MQLDEGRVLYDSRLISEALDSIYSELPIMPLSGEARIAVRLTEVLGDGIKNNRYKVKQGFYMVNLVWLMLVLAQP